MSNSIKKAPSKMIMGVGDGLGQLFVEGDYDSIITLQNKLIELEKLRIENDKLTKKLAELEKGNI